MKFFALVFTFYMLTLSCLPCGDNDECKEKEKQEFSAASTQHGHEHEAENCTPFCSCACCASPWFLQVNSQSKYMSPTAATEKLFCLDDDFDSYHAHAVWQPPRV